MELKIDTRKENELFTAVNYSAKMNFSITVRK